MLGRTHVVGGVSLAAVTASVIYASGVPLAVNNPEILPLILAGGWLGGLMPDIDHPNSTISNIKLMGFPIFKPIAWIINLLLGHRGATHTLWALLMTTLPIFMLPVFFPPELAIIRVFLILFGIGYAVGYLSHLLLDSMTPSGTPMLWPLPDVHLAKLPTGKYDGIVSLVMIVGTTLICSGLLFF